MRRYWIEKNSLNGDIVHFNGDTFHHIFDVCRQQVGSKFEVLNAEGLAHLVEVTEVTKKSAQARVIETRSIPELSYPHIHLALAISRFPVMDAVIEKAVELGVKNIQPLYTEFSFVRSSASLPGNKVDRWDKIVKSATQQSGRGDLMTISSPLSLVDFLGTINRSPDNLVLFAYEGSSTLGIKEYLQQNRGPSDSPVKNIWVLIGSEGGFSFSEVEKMRDLAFYPVTLGSQILRVETACMALVSVLKYEFDLMC